MSRKRLVTSLVCAGVLFFVGAVIFTYALPLTQTVILNPEQVVAKPAVASPIAAEAAKPPQAAPAAQARVVKAAPKAVVASPIQAVPVKPQQAPLAGEAKVVPVAPPPVAKPDNKTIIQKSIAGVVVDPDGTFLPEVDIRVTDPDTNDVLVTGITGDRGTFTLLVPSPKESFDFTFRQEGFTPSVIKGVKTIDNAPVSIRVTMQIARATCALYIKPGAKTTAFVSPTQVSGRAIPAVLYWEDGLAYPAEALQQGLEAVVMAEVKSEADGTISAVRILKGDPHFDEAVMNAVRQWRCRQAYLNGKPHQSVSTVTVRFSLK